MRETLFGVVRCLSTAIDAKDPYTCGHSERVARISVRIGQEMGLSRGEVSDLYLAGLLHDVGKIGIRDEVLLKSGPLTKDEYTHMKEHPITGDRIVSKIKRLSYLCAGVRSHHERYDGTGYPDGLAGESIPLMARIIAVADSCDAMMACATLQAGGVTRQDRVGFPGGCRHPVGPGRRRTFHGLPSRALPGLPARAGAVGLHGRGTGCGPGCPDRAKAIAPGTGSAPSERRKYDRSPRMGFDLRQVKRPGGSAKVQLQARLADATTMISNRSYPRTFRGRQSSPTTSPIIPMIYGTAEDAKKTGGTKLRFFRR